MGCYGIGPSRVMGAIVEIYHDQNGIVWPENIAPYKVHLLEIGNDQAVAKKCETLYQKLLDNNVEVLFDDRQDIGVGGKFADADLIGIPYRLIISPKTKDQVEVKKRSDKDSKLFKVDKILDLLK